MIKLFGQYKHRNSIIHKLDSRLKLFYVIILSILVFTIEDSLSILIFSSFIVIVILLSKLSAEDLIKGLRPFFFIFIFLLLMYLLFSRNKLEQGLITIWRFLILVIISLILTFTTTISSLVIAIEKLIKPLRILNIKPRNIAVMISVAIRFIPVMFINLERLKEAMLARLANLKKFKYIRLIITALLERMFKSASNLSDAMESKLYNENLESNKILRLSKNDYLSTIAILIFILIIY